jgi:hypothetical protein
MSVETRVESFGTQRASASQASFRHPSAAHSWRSRHSYRKAKSFACARLRSRFITTVSSTSSRVATRLRKIECEKKSRTSLPLYRRTASSSKFESSSMAAVKAIGTVSCIILSPPSTAMRDIVRPLIDVALSKGIKIGGLQAEDLVEIWVENAHGCEEMLPWSDSLVSWFNAVISQESNAVFPSKHDQEPAELLEKSLGCYKAPALPCELAPECRSCLAMFGSWDDLATHLARKPKHKMMFRRKN